MNAKSNYQFRMSSFLMVSIFALSSWGQMTSIPDPNFEQALIDQGIDTDATLNGQVPTADISGLGSLDVSGLGINSLTGIEDFISLTVLKCYSNDLTELSVNNNTLIANLQCYNNQISSLDVRSLPNLTTLFVGANNLTEIDVSQNPSLVNLNLQDNPITELNVLHNPNLVRLRAHGLLIDRLNLKNNPNLTGIFVQLNPNLQALNLQSGGNTNVINTDIDLRNTPLTCVAVDDAVYSNANWTLVDAGLSFTDTNCPSDLFITSWETSAPNESIRIPTIGSGYDYYVDWGDGTITNHSDADPSTDATHIYVPAGLHTIKIGGIFPRIYFNNTGDKDKLLEILQWGNGSWTSMENGFRGCSNLTIVALDAPNLSACNTLTNMFRDCSMLNGPMDHWDVSTIISMNRLFQNATAFDQALSNWDVGNVVNGQFLLAGLPNFDQDLSSWNVSSMEFVQGMFQNSSAFNQNLGAWDISNFTDAGNILNNTGLSTANYDSTLIGWATLEAHESTIPMGLNIGAQNLFFCLAAPERRQLMELFTWSINDNGAGGCQNSDLFISHWETTSINEAATVPSIGTGYDYYVDWGDGTITQHSDVDPSTDATHIYALAGVHTIKIGGAFPRIHFDNTGDKDKLLEISQWGAIQWSSMKGAFRGCSNLQVAASDAPNLSDCTSLEGMFRECSSFNAPIGQWDVSNVSNISRLFQSASVFNQDLSAWDVSSVNNVDYAFENAALFDQDLGSWNISAFSTAQNMLGSCGMSVYNYDNTLMGWNTLDPGESSIPSGLIIGVFDLEYCIGEAARQQLANDHAWFIFGDSKFCTATDHFIMVWETTTPNELITIPTTGTGYDYDVDWGDGTTTSHSDLDPSTDATHTYPNAGQYTVKVIGSFPRIFFNFSGDRGKVLNIVQWGSIRWTNMHDAFEGCFNMNSSASDAPDLSNCTNLQGMFSQCLVFNSPIGHWDVSTVTNMSHLFRSAPFNQDIGAWDVSNVTDMRNMFFAANHFNQDIGGWDVSKVTNMNAMFNSANQFDQDLGNWNIGNVISMSSMFSVNGLSVSNYDSTLIGWSTQALQPGINFGAGTSIYCLGEDARNVLTSAPNYWNITDDGKDPNCGAVVNIKAFLQGPYNGISGTMQDSLRTHGLIPLTETYTALGYSNVSGGGETINASILTTSGNDAIVDWVHLELRDKDNNLNILATRNALIQVDGDIVDLDGNSPVDFSIGNDDYYISVQHRNHLHIMSFSAIPISANPVVVDLSDGSIPTFGTDAQADISGTKALWAGDVTDDGVVKYTGQDNDRDPILVDIGGIAPTNTVAGYLNSDINMDGQVKYTGSHNDRDIILQDIGGVVPTNTRIEQMP